MPALSPKQEKRLETEKRRICWPNPDATCLEGGCIFCNTYPYRKVSTIRKYAEKAGVLSNRGIGEQNAWDAFIYGLSHHWNNADSKA